MAYMTWLTDTKRATTYDKYSCSSFDAFLALLEGYYTLRLHSSVRLFSKFFAVVPEVYWRGQVGAESIYSIVKVYR